MIKTVFLTLLLSVLPISELRGAIPFAYFNGISLGVSYILGVLGNLIIIPFGFLFFTLFEKLLKKIAFFNNILEKKALKLGSKFSKSGYLALTLFVALPLPVTGAWTGVFASWFLHLDKKKSSLAIGSGVLIAGIIVSLVLLTGSSLASIFTKNVTL